MSEFYMNQASDQISPAVLNEARVRAFQRAAEKAAERAKYAALHRDDAKVEHHAPPAPEGELVSIQRRLGALHAQLGHVLAGASDLSNRILGSLPEEGSANGVAYDDQAGGHVDAIHRMLNVIGEQANRLGSIVQRLERLG